jgi:hypothetical protein
MMERHWFITRHVRHMDEIAEAACSERMAQLRQLPTFERMPLSYGGTAYNRGHRHDESISRRHQL